MTLDLEPIKARESKATKGPWTLCATISCECDGAEGCFHCFDHQADILPAPGEIGPVCTVAQDEHDDGGFIVNARNHDIPALVAEVEALRRENTGLRGAVEYTLQMMEALPKATTGQLCDWLIRAQSVLGKK